MTDPTPEERSLMEKWGISEKEREQAFGGLGLTVQDLAHMAEEKMLLESGKPARQSKIYADMEAMEDNERNVIRPEKPTRVKKPLGANERDYKERDFQRDFNHWFLKNRHRFSTSCFIELKATPGDSIPFDVVRPSQHAALQACTTDAGVYHQIESDPYKEQSAKPADSVFVRNGVGFLALMYRAKERGNKTFYMVRYEKWLEEQARGERKSLTEERCKILGVMCSL
jgi:hypothetical protein